MLKAPPRSRKKEGVNAACGGKQEMSQLELITSAV